jgi:hypothetical protein
LQHLVRKLLKEESYMTQIANVTVFDGAATPVMHTFIPISVTRAKDRLYAEFRETMGTVPVYASNRLSLTMQLLKSGVSKVEARVVVPVMEPISGQNAAGYTAAPKVAYENTLIMQGFFHQRSDRDGRRLARQMLINWSGDIQTSVGVKASGFVHDLFDYLIFPT